MEEHKIKVIDWIKSGMNYNEGVTLVCKLSGRQGLLTQFAGKENKRKDKLAYELCKVAGLANHTNWKLFIENVDYYGSDNFDKRLKLNSMHAASHGSREAYTDFRVTLNWEGENEFDEKSIYPGLKDEYPVIIHRIMNDLSELYQQRSLLHGKMVGMDDSNKKILVKERVKLLDQIKGISDRFIFLYHTKQNYLLDRIIPQERVIYPEESANKEDKPVFQKNVVELKKQKKNLQTSNSKDQKKLGLIEKANLNQIGKTPVSAKGILIELRIRERIKMIEDIDYQLVNLE